jgi:hypothetical protein
MAERRTTVTTRESLYHLIDALPERTLLEAERLLRSLQAAEDTRMKAEDGAGEVDRLPDRGVDCFATALSLAEDLGPEFSSEDPHALAGRGDDWFETA